MAGWEQDLTHDERLVEGLRAIWVETHKARVAVQWILAIIVAIIVIVVAPIVAALLAPDSY